MTYQMLLVRLPFNANQDCQRQLMAKQRIAECARIFTPKPGNFTFDVTRTP
jgi:hypothetical protein